jgi:hypothetical protein
MTRKQAPPPMPQRQPGPPMLLPQGTSNLRSFWIVWCSMWALGWLLCGFVTQYLSWLLVPVSVLCILLPVGARQKAAYQPQPPQALTAESRPRRTRWASARLRGWLLRRVD